MKLVSFCEHTQVYYPIIQGQISCVKKEPLSSEEEALRRRSRFQKLRREMYSTLRLSQVLRKASYSDINKQQIQEGLQCANAAWQNMDTDTEFVVEKVTTVNLNFTKTLFTICHVFLFLTNKSKIKKGFIFNFQPELA